MTLYELTKAHGEGQGEDMMWTTLELVSDAIESSMDKASKHKLLRALYGKMSGGHYDKDYAMMDTSKMYYRDAEGERHAAPYWEVEDVRAVYDDVKDEIPDYNFWDFFVTINMVKSNMCSLLEAWFPGEPKAERTQRLSELAVNWLNDEDNPYGTTKIWSYLNPA